MCERDTYEGSMVCRYLKCINCGERWPEGVVISVMNADCCRNPNIHVFNNLPEPLAPWQRWRTLVRNDL